MAASLLRPEQSWRNAQLILYNKEIMDSAGLQYLYREARNHRGHNGVSMPRNQLLDLGK
ncbi:hypothetical protein HBI67_029790 [Parastagonospora nodorum]|nr:hypothetical protein HBI47_168600 [Parastagonospora nodorum]KAH6083866.1 hypothetical protein HBI67_029790 [Parastagonospora nodorum]